jgi:hypothetical protein
MFAIEEIKFPKNLFDSKRVQMMVINAMKAQAKLIINRDFKSTTQYWKHRVEFGYQMKFQGGDVRLFMGPTGSSRGARIWKNINDGTANIGVIFNPFYVQKTAYPGSLRTNTSGYLTLPHQRIVGKKPMPTPPGIRAREWTRLIVQDNKYTFAEAIVDAIKRGMRPK